jgi:basic membrane protein A
MAVLCALTLVAAGGDDEGEDASPGTTEEPGDPPAGEEEGTLVENQPDVNRDGKVVIGLAVGGDVNDGGFYQSVRDFAAEFVDENGWELIVVDQIDPADYVTEFGNLARQGLDMVVTVGGVTPYDAMMQLSCRDEFSDVAWVMLAGTAAEIPNECFINVRDDVFEINYITGVAAALVMQRSEATTAGFISGPELDFSVAARRAFEAGIKSQIPDAELLFAYTGSMDDAALAVEAARAQIGRGAHIVYPYLGGATNAVAAEANDADVFVLASAVNRCDDPSYDFIGAGLFSKAPYLVPLLAEFRDGELRVGFQRVFRVGIDEEPGTVICDATADEQAILDQVAADIASGAIVPQELAEAID